MKYTFGEIVEVLSVQEAHIANDIEVRIPLLDSRQLSVPRLTLFFALKGKRNHGNKYVSEMYDKGVRCFISDDISVLEHLEDVNYIIVSDVLEALHELALHHRQRFQIPVIGITGSEHKTLLKEWLYELLKEKYNIVKSPGSFNSQYGVPLSILQMTDRHDLGIFEAGISEKGQMERLQMLIKPTVGVLTSVESIYDLHFSDDQERLNEYLKLFIHTPQFVIREKYSHHLTIDQKAKALIWGESPSNHFQIENLNKRNSNTPIYIVSEGQRQSLDIRTQEINEEVAHNKVVCYILLHCLGQSNLLPQLSFLTIPDLGVKTLTGINGTTILHDVTSRDLTAFGSTMSKTKMIQGQGKIWIVFSKDHLVPQLKEFWDLITESVMYQDIEKVLVSTDQPFHRDIAILSRYNENDDLSALVEKEANQGQTILVFGDAENSLHSLVYYIQEKRHNTVLEIDLSALNKNLKAFEHYLKPQTKLMVMVKANAYGAGALKVAHLLKGRRVDYLGVAFTDEGIELRKAGIHLPIMVLNVDPQEFELVVEYNLEPEIYSLDIIKKYQLFLEKRGLKNQKIHIKLDTGMHRLGFLPHQIDELISLLKSTEVFHIQSVFSHLAASGDLAERAFTEKQIAIFEEISLYIKSALDIDFDRHILNSAGIVRYPQYQYDMVRLGIGMYGVGMESVSDQIILRPVHTLKSRISQIKSLVPGDSVGYNRAGKVDRPTRIGIISIGYADGLLRLAGNGQFSVMIHQILCPTIGNICMDMTMIDLTDHPHVETEDEVVVFGEGYSIEELSNALQTISYEVLTQIDHRVGRVYVSN